MNPMVDVTIVGLLALNVLGVLPAAGVTAAFLAVQIAGTMLVMRTAQDERMILWLRVKRWGITIAALAALALPHIETIPLH